MTTLKTTILLLAAGSVLFTSCIKNEYYNVEPPPPEGYQYIFDDNFDYDSHNWSFNDFSNSAFVDVTGGTLNYTYTPANDGTNTVAINTGANVSRDFLVQAGISSDNAMGLVFGVSDYDYGYSFLVDDQGYFAVYKEGNAQTGASVLIDWQNTTAIKAGWNDIELEQVNGYWTGYANGAQIFQIAARQLQGTKFGFLVLANTRGRADYLTVKW